MGYLLLGILGNTTSEEMEKQTDWIEGHTELRHEYKICFGQFHRDPWSSNGLLKRSWVGLRWPGLNTPALVTGCEHQCLAS